LIGLQGLISLRSGHVVAGQRRWAADDTCAEIEIACGARARTQREERSET
jgi:hypothetical protein